MALIGNDEADSGFARLDVQRDGCATGASLHGVLDQRDQCLLDGVAWDGKSPAFR